MTLQTLPTRAQLLDILAKDVSPSVSNSNQADLFHGFSGLFGENCALSREIISNIVTPKGLLGVLPVQATNESLLRQGYITGINPDGTGEPIYPCDDAPRGTYSICRADFNLGRVQRDSETIEITEAILRSHRGDSNFTLRNDMLQDGLGNLSTPRLSQQDNGQVLDSVTRSQMKVIALAFQRELSQMLWQGDSTAPPPANTAGGGKVSFDGLDRFITTGIVDSVSLVPCPTMDSQTYDFNYADVCAPVGAGPPIVLYNIVQLVQDMMFNIENIATRTGLSPVQWAIVMRPKLFRELSACWPCLYETDRCGSGAITGDGTPVRFNDGSAIRARDSYRRGMFLPVNGIDYPVILDDGIFEQNNVNTPALPVGTYASSVYIVPITVLGGTPVTYLRYNDYRAISPEISFLNGMQNFWTDDGKFIWSTTFVKTCYELSATIQPGLVMRTPHLAGRIDNVQYSPAFPLRSPYPGDPDYLT